jgi:hypothetical protein
MGSVLKALRERIELKLRHVSISNRLSYDFSRRHANMEPLPGTPFKMGSGGVRIRNALICQTHAQ